QLRMLVQQAPSTCAGDKMGEAAKATLSPVPATVPDTMLQGAPGELSEQFGRYRILKLLGKGGMGTVYLAEDTQLQRKVALKVPRFTSTDGPQVLERFTREARAAAGIEHPNICPVYDVGEVNGTHYLTMAYIQGRPLSDYVRHDKPLAQQ